MPKPGYKKLARKTERYTFLRPIKDGNKWRIRIVENETGKVKKTTLQYQKSIFEKKLQQYTD